MDTKMILVGTTELILIITIYIISHRIDAIERENDAIKGRIKAIWTTVEQIDKKLNERITSLENGLNPDYEAAKKAKEALNDFSKGITGILGYDPYAALHKDNLEE